MNEELKMYTCDICGKPTPNYREWSRATAALFGERGYSRCDWLVCPRDLADELHDKMLLPLGVQVYCPDNGGSLRLRYDLSMRGAGSLREDSTLCLLWAMLMDSYSRWRTTGGLFIEASD